KAFESNRTPRLLTAGGQASLSSSSASCDSRARRRVLRKTIEPTFQPLAEFVPVPVLDLKTRKSKELRRSGDGARRSSAGRGETALANDVRCCRSEVTRTPIRIGETRHPAADQFVDTGSTRLDLAMLETFGQARKLGVSDRVASNLEL